MSPLYNKNSGGYIALITVLLMSFVLLTVSVTVGASGFLGRFSQLDYENKRVRAGLAEACVDVAILEITKGNNPAPNTCVSVGDTCGTADAKKFCKICKVENPTGDPTVLVRAVYNNSYTNLDVDFAKVGSKFFVTDWDEIVNYQVAHPSDLC